ncbi:TonB-dependent receptor plug domain-containing protein, partial [bacterium]|nr:TonB-dependent receptor plug domain-containing protein [bacterium]
MKLRTLAVLLVYVVLTSLANAQEHKSNPLYQADTVTVVASKNMTLSRASSIAMKMPMPIQSTAASVGVVTKALIDLQDGTVLSDALTNVSGVNVQSGFGVHDYFLVRGFDALSSGLVLTDGAPEPEITFYNLYNVERVEVLKGPGAFLYGGSSLSGTVNVARKQPVFRNFMNIAGSLGKFHTYRSSFDAGFVAPNSNIAFRVNGLWRESDHYRDELGSQTIAVNPAMTWRFSDNSALTANFEYVDSDS